MDANTISTAISSLGFPIFCVIALGYFILYLTKVGQADKEKLYAELAENRTVNQGFLSTLQTITDEIKKVDNKVDQVKEDVEEIKNKMN